MLTYKPSTLEEEDLLPSESEAALGYMRPHPKTKS